jgi:hypothetical protein
MPVELGSAVLKKSPFDGPFLRLGLFGLQLLVFILFGLLKVNGKRARLRMGRQ